jgi:hypothetical protein
LFKASGPFSVLVRYAYSPIQGLAGGTENLAETAAPKKTPGYLKDNQARSIKIHG